MVVVVIIVGVSTLNVHRLMSVLGVYMAKQIGFQNHSQVK